METGQFYCVGCQELKDAVFGHRVFKTGYFRLVYPLGFCLVCQSGERTVRPAEAAGGPGTVFEPQDDPPRTSPAALPEGIERPAVRQAAV
jgi:hypothetical protein